MMKRLLIVAAALAALWAAPARSDASSFGLTYSRQCSSCSFCVRPYNAFSSVTCGVASMGGCGYGGCGYGGKGCCLRGCRGFDSFNGGCCGPFGHGKFGHGCWGCGRVGHGCRGCGTHKLFCCRLRKRMFGAADYPVFPEDSDPGAFGMLGQEVAFFGTPAIRDGYNPGCHMAWGWDNQPVQVPGHTPPSVYVQPPNASCSTVWLPPQPSPGMYGIPPGYGYYPTPYYQAPYAPTQQKPIHGRNLGGTAPASYQQYDGQGGYVPASWWYPGYGYDAQQQGGYAPGYYYGQ